jgi:spore_cwlD: N-acetylmuramoyl-L-alanine amidase CwlD
MMFLLTSCTKSSSDEKNAVDIHKAEQQEEQQKEEKEKKAEEIQPDIKEEIQTEGEEIEAVQEQPEEPAQTTNGKVVVIDPGHSSVITGETEPIGPGASERKPADAIGTSGTITGIPEYELTLAVSQKLQDELESRGYTVAMTRESSDIPVSCVQRAEVANQLQADVFLRIHAKWFGKHTSRGSNDYLYNTQ